MWTRQELKARGKIAFNRNYWKSVLAGLVVIAVTGVTIGGSGAGGSVSGGYEEFKTQLDAGLAQSGISPAVFVGVLFGIFGIALLISTLISIFLITPLQVGTDRFFLKNAQEPAKAREIFFAFRSSNYLKIVGAKFLATLFAALWSVLLVIPGIIKEFQYLMVGYILADNPDIGVMDALRKSKQMMKGNKWKAFVLCLSFFGWEILNVLTFGILDIFYVRPYMEATFAELYLKLKEQQN